MPLLFVKFRPTKQYTYFFVFFRLHLSNRKCLISVNVFSLLLWILFRLNIRRDDLNQTDNIRRTFQKRHFWKRLSFKKEKKGFLTRNHGAHKSLKRWLQNDILYALQRLFRFSLHHPLVLLHVIVIVCNFWEREICEADGSSPPTAVS